jgi:hypothetical protein
LPKNPVRSIILSHKRNKEVPIMVRRYKSVEEVEFFSLPMAKWVIGVLGLLIAVVGKESLLGLTLRQTRSEISSLVKDEEGIANSLGDQWFLNN